MIILTGGAGFIGSVTLAHLNEMGESNILVVDNLGHTEKWKNLVGKSFSDYLHKNDFLNLIESGKFDSSISAVIHLGACSSTTETDAEYVMRNNFRYSQILAKWSLKIGARFIYASSAATYGDGLAGFDDDVSKLPQLRPLNIYGYSKHAFDLWAQQSGVLKLATGLKFFNVFGPNEYHKGEMQSVALKAYRQVQQHGKIDLFKSYRSDYTDGGQKRDFIWVQDCARVICWLLEQNNAGGLFNLGSGQASRWEDLATAIFAACGKEKKINYIDMPTQLREKYQYYTKAEMSKLQILNPPIKFTSLENAVRIYIDKYLQKSEGYI